MSNFDGPGSSSFSFYACCGARRDEGDGHLFCRRHPDMGHVRATWANLEAPPCEVCAAWPKDRRYLWAANVFGEALEKLSPEVQPPLRVVYPVSPGGGEGERRAPPGGSGGAAMVGHREQPPSPRGEDSRASPEHIRGPGMQADTGEEEVLFSDFFPVFLERALASTGTVRESMVPPSATPGIDKVFAAASVEVGAQAPRCEAWAAWPVNRRYLWTPSGPRTCSPVGWEYCLRQVSV